MNLNDYVLCLKLAIVAYVYSEMLTEPGMILNWLHNLLSRLPDFLFKPLIGCHKCVAGQMAFWVWCFSIHAAERNTQNYIYIIHSMGNMAFFISLTIFITWIISKLADRLNK